MNTAEHGRNIHSEPAGAQIDFLAVASGLQAKLLIRDPDGQTIFANKRWIDYTGLAIDDTHQKGFLAAVDARDHELLLGGFASAREKVREAEINLRLLQHDNQQARWHVLRLNPVFDNDEKLRFWCFLIVDVHDQSQYIANLERKKDEAQEELLRASAALIREKEMSQLAEAIPQIVWTSHIDGQFHHFNKRWLEYTGLSIEESGGEGWTRAVHADDIVKFRQQWDICRKESAPFEIECRLLRAEDRSYRWHLCRALPICDDSGRILKWFGTCTDVHDQLRAQEEAVELSLRLQTSEGALRQLAEAVPDVVWSADEKGCIDYFNQRWYEYTGQDTADSLGLGWQEYVHEDERKELESAWQAAITGGACLQLEHRMRSADGDYRWFLVRAVPSRNDCGEVTKWFGTFSDIELQKQASERLEQRVQERTNEFEKLLQKHKETSAELQKMAYTISHELQSPLKTITSDLNLLSVRYNERLGADADEFIRNCTEAASKTQRMVDDLWIYARVDQPGTAIRRLDLNEVFDKTVTALSPLIRRRKAVVERDKLPEVNGNPDQVLYLFTQLIENGLTFNYSATPKVHVSARNMDSDWCISFKDNGIGFDMIDAAQIFKMFVRLKKDFFGTGMGLAICRKIISFHGGNIWVESRPSAGSTFFVSLPVNHKAI